MRRRGGGSTQPSLQPLRESMPSNRNESNIFSRNTIKTIIITSTVWAVILSIALYGAMRQFSSSNCSQNDLIRGKKFHLK
jgi:hypothetical protein